MLFARIQKEPEVTAGLRIMAALAWTRTDRMLLALFLGLVYWCLGTFSVAYAQTAPVANDDGTSVKTGEWKYVNVLANDAFDITDSIAVSHINGQPIAPGDTVTIAQYNAQVKRDQIHNGLLLVYYNPPDPDPQYPNIYDSMEFGYTITSGSGQTSSATVTVGASDLGLSLHPAPFANDLDASADSGLSESIAIPNSDPDGWIDLVEIVTPPSHGTASASGLNVIYQSQQGFTGFDSLEFRVRDNEGQYSGVATLSIAVNVVPNQSPVAHGETFSVAHGQSTRIDVRANDADAEDAVTSLKVVVGNGVSAQGGTLSVGTNLTDQRVTYTPPAGFSGTDTFTYRVQDTQGLYSGYATAAVTVENAIPNAANDSYSVVRGGSEALNVRSNDSDADDGIGGLSIVKINGTAIATGQTITFSGTGGTVTRTAQETLIYDASGVPETTWTMQQIGPGEWEPVPAPGPSGDSFTYQVSDGYGGVDAATVSITFTETNDPWDWTPSSPYAVSGVAGEVFATVDLKTLGSDPDPGDADVTTFSIVSGVLPAGLSLSSQGALSGTPTEVVTDRAVQLIATGPGVNGQTQQSAAFTLSVTIGSNGPWVWSTTSPPPSTVNGTVNEAIASLDLSTYGSDPDGDATSFYVVSGTLPAGLTLSTAGVLSGTPTTETAGTSVTIVGRGAALPSGTQDSAGRNLTFNISAGNQLPVAVNDSAVATSGQAQVINVLSNDSDDGTIDLVSIVTQPLNGSAAVNGNNTVTYTSDPDYTGSDSFTYRVTDNDEAQSGMATVTITVNPNAVTSFVTYDYDALGRLQLANYSADTDTNVSWCYDANGNRASVQSGAGSLTAPNCPAPPKDIGQEPLQYNAPNFIASSYTADSTTIAVPSGTIDGDVMVAIFGGIGTSSSSVNLPAGWTSIGSVERSTGVDTIFMQAAYREASSEPASYNYSLNSGSFPIASVLTYRGSGGVGANYTLDSGESTTRTNSGIVTTQDNSNIVLFSIGVDAEVVTAPTGMSQRTFWQTNEYAWDETIATAGATGARNSLHYDDGYQDSTLFVTSMIEVLGSFGEGSLNQAPIAVNDNYTQAASTVSDRDVLLNDTDPDGDTLTLTVEDSAYASIVSNQLRFTAPATAGIYAVNYTVSDGNGGTDTATATFTVSAVNAAPVAVNDTTTATSNQTEVINVLANDSDSDGTITSVSIVAAPANGVAVVNGDKTISYTSTSGYTGSDSFTYKATDDDGAESAVATVSVTVAPAAGSGLPAATLVVFDDTLISGAYLTAGNLSSSVLSDPGDPVASGTQSIRVTTGQWNGAGVGGSLAVTADTRFLRFKIYRATGSSAYKIELTHNNWTNHTSLDATTNTHWRIDGADSLTGVSDLQEGVWQLVEIDLTGLGIAAFQDVAIIGGASGGDVYYLDDVEFSDGWGN